MRVLVGWDDPTEAETITLILDVDRYGRGVDGVVESTSGR